MTLETIAQFAKDLERMNPGQRRAFIDSFHARMVHGIKKDPSYECPEAIEAAAQLEARYGFEPHSKKLLALKDDVKNYRKELEYFILTVADREEPVPVQTVKERWQKYDGSAERYVIEHILKPQIRDMFCRGDYLETRALARGIQASFMFTPKNAKQKKAYQLGLDLWLNYNGLRGIRVADISERETLRGFRWGLASYRIAAPAIDEAPVPERAAVLFRDEIAKTLNQYDDAKTLNQYDDFSRVAPDLAVGKARFEQGLRLAEEYARRAA
jgi:hypothetical protein